MKLVLPAMARRMEVLARNRGRDVPPLFVVPANQLPDALPPFRAGSVRADFEGNLWIRTRATVEGTAVYDVVNRRGRFAQVRVSPGTTIVGFGRNGAMYVALAEADGARLERVRVTLGR
jgi:hypothetical protein